MTWKDYLDIAYLYAQKQSGCRKVQVGSIIVGHSKVLALGANRGLPDLCNTVRGCMRVEKYGNDSKSHRNPEDCRAIHSEIDAICNAAEAGQSTKDASIFVTRYPCEACAKAIISAGINRVFYGGTTKISKVTQDMFDKYNVVCVHVFDWMEDPSDR